MRFTHNGPTDVEHIDGVIVYLPVYGVERHILKETLPDDAWALMGPDYRFHGRVVGDDKELKVIGSFEVDGKTVSEQREALDETWDRWTQETEARKNPPPNAVRLEEGDSSP